MRIHERIFAVPPYAVSPFRLLRSGVLWMLSWETDFSQCWYWGELRSPYEVAKTPAQYWINIVHPWVQKLYPVLGLGSGERLLWRFQTPFLYWIKFPSAISVIAADNGLGTFKSGAKMRGLRFPRDKRMTH